MLSTLSQGTLKLFGWKLKHPQQDVKGCIVIGAPHTTNWDLPITLLTFWGLKLKCHWAMKDSMFFFPLGCLFRAMGGIPVNRKVRNDFLRVIQERFAQNKDFNIAIAPEGTRSYTDHWKFGFYQLAMEVNADIALAFADYEKKEIGIAKVFTPCGDIEKDFSIFKDFYADVQGRYPEKQSDVALRPKELKLFQRKSKQQATEKAL